MKCGIVGLPNVGKSTLFNFMTASRNARAENFPFCTIDPNVATVPYIDERLSVLSKHTKSSKILYASLEFVDIAGLVPNAHLGEGLGNKFLGHILETDLILHVVRSFQGSITHVLGDIDPIRDFEVIFMELILSDLERVEKMLKKNKDDKDLLLAKQQLERGEKTTHKQFLTSKPIVMLCNGDAPQNLVDYCATKKIPLLSLDIALLEEISFECRADKIIDSTVESNISAIVQECLKTLNMITYFTTGPKESRAWMIPANTEANMGAGKIHTDFIKKLISCEVISFCDYPSTPRILGKNYIIQDGDVVEFRVGR